MHADQGQLPRQLLGHHRPVCAHGDQHEYTVDRQLGLANLTRLEVPGSPNVGWVRVTITPNAREPFAFEPHVIPRWKVW